MSSLNLLCRIVGSGSPVDPYLDPATGVLRNKLGISDALVLARLEHQVVTVRGTQLLGQPTLVNQTWDVRYWCEVHRFLLGDLYEWAGEFRTVDITKDDHTFHPVALLGLAVRHCASQLAILAARRSASDASLTLGMSTLLADMNEAHPFREGNGRTQRLIISQLAGHHGRFVDWAVVSERLNLEASRASGTDPGAFVALLQAAMSSDRRSGGEARSSGFRLDRDPTFER